VRTVADRVAEVRERLAAAEARAGRPPGSAALVAVTKTHPPELIREGVAAGLTLLGESRIQEAAGKVGAIEGVTWHLVGHLQRNKARQALELFSLIHSLGSERLARRLHQLGEERGRPAQVLVQVNLSREASKSGVSEEGLPGMLDLCAGLGGIRVRGLMTIPAPVSDPDENRPVFARLRGLLEAERARGREGMPLDELSMGMTDDFEVAAEEGATLVRVGRALFGARGTAHLDNPPPAV
jgi:pyridoxal phosphate enzyme (YggS family)